MVKCCALVLESHIPRSDTMPTHLRTIQIIEQIKTLEEKISIVHLLEAVLSCRIDSPLKQWRDSVLSNLQPIFSRVLSNEHLTALSLRVLDTAAKQSTSLDIIEAGLLSVLPALKGQKKVLDWAFDVTESVMRGEVATLASKSSGLHASASTAKLDDMRAFSTENLALLYQKIAHRSYKLQYALMDASGDKIQDVKKRMATRTRRTATGGHNSPASVQVSKAPRQAETDSDAEYWGSSESE